jgi:hypothetical protein
MQAAYNQRMNELLRARREIRAKFDAAQTFSANENHWENADHFDPHSAASITVRRALRSRSRYEVIENNPYLKGTLLTLANDFVGRGPRLQIIDERLTEAQQAEIEDNHADWASEIKMRQKLWRMKMAKFTDGETFAIPFVNRNRRQQYPIPLDFYIIETDRISTASYAQPPPPPDRKIGEIDGVRFDAYEQPTEFFLLNRHPGGFALDIFNPSPDANAGKWIDAKYMIHWFRRDRGWLRGIPELTPSLPLCALLRRYTLSIVRHAEVLADFTILLETENPASPNPLIKDELGNLFDDPFDLWPIEMGMMSNLPYGYKVKQLESVPLGQQYDTFTGALLREIMRPMLAPFNIASGSSKDSNMASGVLDNYIYQSGQNSERASCEEDVLEAMFYFWWNEATRSQGYLKKFTDADRTFANRPPKHRWRWDRVGIEHTDPQKVAQALQIMQQSKMMTDGDIQETYFNRDVRVWQNEILRDKKFRDKIDPQPAPATPAPGKPGGTSPPQKKPAAKKAAARRRRHGSTGRSQLFPSGA